MQRKQLFWCSLLKAWHNSLQRIAFDEFTSTDSHNPVIYEEVTTKMKQKNCLLLFTFTFNLILYISVADNTCFVKAVHHIGEVPTIFPDMGIRGVPTIFPDGGSTLKKLYNFYNNVVYK